MSLFDNLRAMRENYQREQLSRDRDRLVEKIEQLIKDTIPEHVHDHPDADPVEAADNTANHFNELRKTLNEFLGFEASNDIFADLTALTKKPNMRRVVELIVEQLVNPESVQDTLTLLESGGEIKRLADTATERARNSLFGALEYMQQRDAKTAEAMLQRSLLQGNGSMLGAQTPLGVNHFGFGPLSKDAFEDTLLRESRLEHFRSMLDREFGNRSGLITGEAGLQMLSNVLRAKESITIGMFQLEHPVLLQALKAQQRQGLTINSMLSPPTKSAKEGGGVAEVGFMNQVAYNLLGETSVQFDPEVMRGEADYAHYKFVATDLDSSDITQVNIMIGSFNMTRGALGQIVDRAGNLYRKRPNNFELGWSIGYDLVRDRGLREEVFRKIVAESRQYRDWLFGRGDRSLQYNSNPEHILTGPQTYERIQRSLGTGERVNAFFMLNVITDAGMVDLRGPKGAREGFYHDIERALRANSQSKITIFVSKGFTGLRTENLGEENAPESLAFQKLRSLEQNPEFSGRFQLVETNQYLHSKAAVIFKAGGVADIIGGTANVSAQGFGGQARDVGLFLSSTHFDDRMRVGGIDWVTEQAMNILSYMWSITAKPIMRGSISETSNASTQRILHELKLRLNPDLTRLVSVQEIWRPGADGVPVQVGSLVSLSLRVKDANNRVLEVPNVYRFRVMEYENHPGRVYVPELHKVIDPVLAMAMGREVDMRPGQKDRGTLTSLEVEPAGVIAAALELMSTQVSKQAESLLHSVGNRAWGNAAYNGLVKRMAGDSFRAAFAHFEGLPLGQYATDARQYKRLIYGLQFRQLTGQLDRDIQAAKSAQALAQEYGGWRGRKSVPMLTMAEDLVPKLSPESIEASFPMADWDLAFELASRRVGGNAPNEVLRRRDGFGVTRESLMFTVLAQSMSWDAPSNVLLSEGLKYLGATDYDETLQQMAMFMSPEKLDQLAQRLQNMLGADSGFLTTGAQGGTHSYLQTMRSHIQGSEVKPDEVREGIRLNIAMLWGLNESTLLNAELFRGGYVGRRVHKRMSLPNNQLINQADVPITMFDGRLRLSPTKTWQIYDPKTGTYIDQAKGAPLLTIGSDEKYLRTFEFMNGSRKDVMTARNPIFGIAGAHITVDELEQVALEGNKTEWNLKYTIHNPIGSSMRMLSQGMKMVTVGVGGEFFDQFLQGLNQGINERRDADLGGGPLGFGSVGNYYQMVGQALDLHDEYGQLSSNKVHILAGEGVVKSGVALLHTGAALLKNAAWRKHFRSIFEDKNKFAMFETMIGRLQLEVVAGKAKSDALQEKFSKNEKLDQAELSLFKKQFLLEGLDTLLEGTGQLEKRLTDLLKTGRREKYLQIIDKFSDPNFRTATDLQDRVVLSAAAAYHVLGAFTAGEITREFMAATSLRLSGKSTSVLNTPNLNLDLPLFLQIIDNFSVSAVAQSSRQSAMFHTYYTGDHSQAVLTALSQDSSVERRSRMVGELLAIGYLGGSAIQVARAAVKRFDGSRAGSGFEVSLEKPNLMIAGVHFEPLAYTYKGISEAAEGKLLELSEIVRDITYGTDELEFGAAKARGEHLGDSWVEDRLNEKKQRALALVADIRDDYQLTSGRPSLRGSSQLSEDYVKVFELMSRARVGAPVMRVPEIQFEESGRGDGTYLLKEMSYSQISMLSPDAAVKLQSFEDYMGPMLKLQVEVLRENITIKNLLRHAKATGGTISQQVRDQYENWLAKVHQLRDKIREAGTTDIQKHMAALSSVGGFAMIANTFPSFNGMDLGKDQEGRVRTIENTIVLGDQAMMAVMDKATKALQMARNHIADHVMAGTFDNDVLMKLAGKAYVFRDQVSFVNELSLPEAFKIGADDADGRSISNRSSGTILSQIQDSFDAMKKSRAAFSKLVKEYKPKANLQDGAKVIQDELEAFYEQKAIVSHLIDHGGETPELLARLVSAADRVATISNFNRTAVQDFDEFRAKVTGSFAEYALAHGRQENFALRLQKHLLERKLAIAPSIDPIAQEDIKAAIGIVDEKLDMLSMNQSHRERLDKRIEQLQEKISGTSNPRDQREWGKLLDFAVMQQTRINSGLEYKTGELLSAAGQYGVRGADLIHALGAVGINIDQMLGHLDNAHSFADRESVLNYIDSVQHKMFSSKAIIEAIADSSMLLERGIAVAMTRAGSPVGWGGVTGMNVMSVRELNWHFKQLGTSFHIDEYMARRSMFLHMSGMAVGLGDFDGDNAIVATIERYTLLQQLQAAAGDTGLVAIERSANNLLQQIKDEHGNETQVAELRQFTGGYYNGKKLTLREELSLLTHQITEGKRALLTTHIESYLGLEDGGVSQLARDMYGPLWVDAEAKASAGDPRDLLQLQDRAAITLNKFANDMFSEIESNAHDMIVKQLKKTGDPNVGYQVSNTSIDRMAEIMESREFKDSVYSWYKKSSTKYIEKALTPVFGGKVDMDQVLRYGAKVAFASTKLIGNWTNIQTMMQALNSSQRMMTYSIANELKQDFRRIADESGDTRALAALQKQVEDFVSTETNKSDLIFKRTSGFMQKLQQATRDAIKLKSARQGADDMVSMIKEMRDADPIIQAIDISINLIQGRSVFGDDHPDLNRGTSNYEALFDGLDVDQLIKVSLEGNQVRAELAAGVKDTELFKTVIDPMIDAARKAHEAADKLKMKWGATKEQAVNQQQQLTDETTEWYTTGLLYAHAVIKNHAIMGRMQDYRRALSAESPEDYEALRHSMDDQLKLLFLHEQLRGDHMDNSVALERAMGDVVNSYVAGRATLEKLETDARSIDPTGHFYANLQGMASGYLRGKDSTNLFGALRRESSLHYQIMADIESDLASSTKLNPLADQGQEGFRELYRSPRAMSEKAENSVVRRAGWTALFTMSGAFVATSGIFGGTGAANAATMGDTPKRDRGTMGRLADYAAMSILNWEPVVALRQIDLIKELNNHEKFLSGLAMVGAMGIGHVASTMASRSLSQMRGVTMAALERSSGVISMASMMAVGHAFSKLTEDVVARNPRRAEVFMSSHVVDDLDATSVLYEAVMSSAEDFDVLEGEVEETELGSVPRREVVESDGTRIGSVPSGVLTAADEDGNPTGAHTMADVMSRPVEGDHGTNEGFTSRRGHGTLIPEDYKANTQLERVGSQAKNYI